MKTFLVIIILFTAINYSAQSQHSKCGTIVTPEMVASERAKLSAAPVTPAFAPIYCLNKTLSITAHIISDSLGNFGITEPTILSAVSALNAAFSPICVSFQVCQFNYINNYKYNRFLKPAEEDELITLYSIPNTINIYFAQTIETTPGSTVGGYAYLPGGPDFIIITKSAPGVIVHEMGHFFGLYHTFETIFGVELANGSNCLTTGDLVCDTPGDPGLGNTPSPDCQLNPYVMDINGEWYVPNIGNTMSYYSSDCECGFTPGQYNRMADEYLTNRFYLW